MVQRVMQPDWLLAWSCMLAALEVPHAVQQGFRNGQVVAVPLFLEHLGIRLINAYHDSSAIEASPTAAALMAAS
jgi:hypothetical protein